MSQTPTRVEERMKDEWLAWQSFVQEWKKVLPDQDFNDLKFRPMVKAIEAWGRALHDLIIVNPSSYDGGVS